MESRGTEAPDSQQIYHQLLLMGWRKRVINGRARWRKYYPAPHDVPIRANLDNLSIVGRGGDAVWKRDVQLAQRLARVR